MDHEGVGKVEVELHSLVTSAVDGGVRRQGAGRFGPGERKRLYPLKRRLILQAFEKRKISCLCWESSHESSHDSSAIQPTAKSLYALRCNLISPAVNPTRQAMKLVTLRRMRVTTVAVEEPVAYRGGWLGGVQPPPEIPKISMESSIA